MVSADFERKSLSTLRSMLDVMQPEGPGGIDYLSVHGQPVLVDINTGRFNGCHFPKLFVERYSSDSAF